MLLEKAIDLLWQKESLHWDNRLGLKDNFPRVDSKEKHSLLKTLRSQGNRKSGIKVDPKTHRPFLGRK